MMRFIRQTGVGSHSHPSSSLVPAVLLAALLAVGACGRGGSAETAEGAEAAPAGTPGAETPATGGAPTITLTAEQQQNAGIALGVATRRGGVGGIEATAQIEAAADRSAAVGTRIPGRIESVRVAEGQQVRRGEVVAILESTELGRAKADYLSSLATANVTRETADRERALFERRISAEREWRQAEAEAVRARAEKEADENRLHALGLADADLADLRVEGHYNSSMPLRAPLAGTVTERRASLGQMVEPADVLFRIVDLREVWLVVDVYEQDVARVKVGQRADVRTAANADETLTGTVTNIGAIVESASRTVKVRVVLPNPRGTLRPGTFATVRLSDAGAKPSEQVLAIPASAVQRDGDGTIVFRPAGPGRFVAQPVEVGEASGGWVPVRNGLAAGDSVVTAGAFILKSELRKGELGEEEH